MTGRSLINAPLTNTISDAIQIHIDNSTFTDDINKLLALNTLSSNRSILNLSYKLNLSSTFTSFLINTPVTTSVGSGLQTLSVGRTYDNLNADGATNASLATGPQLDEAGANNILDLEIYADQYSPGLDQAAYAVGFLVGAFDKNTVVKSTGNTPDPFPTLAPVAATTDTGILGISVCTSSGELTSIAATSPWWVVATKGPIFISGLTGGVIGQPVYYTAAGAITLTAAGNVLFGTIVATSLTGATINFPSPSFI